jgi:hypothetical protein
MADEQHFTNRGEPNRRWECGRLTRGSRWFPHAFEREVNLQIRLANVGNAF